VTKFIRIGIADKNDNPPYFDKTHYEAEVDENEDIQHTVLTVTAKDLDECKFTFSSTIFQFAFQMNQKFNFLLRPPHFASLENPLRNHPR
jgi:hypothetical protein